MKYVRGNWLITALAAALVVAALAGRGYLHRWFGYEVFALALAGFGTLALAYATTEQTGISRKTLQASLRQAEVSHETLLATLRPVLIEAARTVVVGDDAVVVRLRNAGTGPAFMREVRMRWYEKGQAVDGATTYLGRSSPFTVAAGEEVALWFDLGGVGKERLDYLLDEMLWFWVEADYRDVTNQQLETVKVEFRYLKEPDAWVLTDIQHYPIGGEGKHEPGRANIG